MDNDNEKKGYLWHETNAQVLRKGTYTINGKKRYGGILKSQNNKGEDKYEFFECVGLLHLNDPQQKKSERSPDMGGKITQDCQTYKLGCWARESEQGTPYTSLGFQEIEEEKDTNAIEAKIPF